MNKEKNFDVGVIGGGLAGLSAAIHLSQLKYSVVLVEKNTYPNHKVCGEYISNEVLPYLKQLGFDPFEIGAVPITNLRLTTRNGKSIETLLGNGGFGISRYAIDHALYNLAKKSGVTIVHDTVINVVKQETSHVVQTKSGNAYRTIVVQGAFGKRDKLDKVLQRKFSQKKAPFLAVKTHLEGDFPDDLVGLYNFKGGYGGLSKIEKNRINFCYIVTYETFKKYKDVDLFKAEVLCENPELKTILGRTTSLFEQPLTISQIDFSKKELVVDGLLMTGDAAGLIHPLCGNGMSMAIQSAQIFATLVHAYLSGQLTREELEFRYQIKWNLEFKKRLRMGRVLAQVFQNPRLSRMAYALIRRFPSLLEKIIRQTHGKSLLN